MQDHSQNVSMFLWFWTFSLTTGLKTYCFFFFTFLTDAEKWKIYEDWVNFQWKLPAMFLITVNRQVIKFLLKHLNGREDVVDLSAESPKTFQDS